MIELHAVSRSFGDRRVLNEVSFTVAGGRMTGFVGGNGAGKTTTMRIILGVLAANSGSVTLNGTELSDEDRSRFGYMPEERGLYPKMRVSEQLVYLGRLHGLSAQAARNEAKTLLDRLGLAERANDPLESLSLGNQQRAQIAAALVHRPIALVLDEPFSGLDPIAVDVVLSVLRDYAAQGVPVLFSSHQLDIVERLCDDVVVIGDGRILASGSREALRATHAGSEYELELVGAAADAGWVREQPGIQVTHLDGGYVRFNAESEDQAQSLLAQAVRQGSGTGGPSAPSRVLRFGKITPSLAQIFKEVVQ